MATGLRPQRLVLAQLERDLSAVPQQRLPEHLQQMAAMGDDDGVGALARALRHPREEVAEAARRELLVELQRWQELPPKLAARRLALLADELARDIDQAPGLAQSASAELATRMLLWPQPADALDYGRFLAQCEAILARVGQPSGAAAQRWAAARGGPRPGAGRRRDARRPPTSNCGRSSRLMPSCFLR
jgi:hypothetical protein